MGFVVIGGGGGIGAEVCRRLRATGAGVLACGRDEQKLTNLAAECGVAYQVLDATSSDQVERAFAVAAGQFGQVVGAVNCAGSLLLKPAHLTTEAEWQATLASNLTTAFATVKAAAKAMMPQGGSIVLMSSAAARTGLANHEAIAAAKAGVIGLTISAAASYAARGIRVNAVAPGLVATPMTSRITSNEASLKASAGLHALGRIGSPQEVASAILWLLDPAQSWVTGQVLGVDGGLGAVRPARS
jgi:NAD(P)-dependent dehydrogenase (short-subunit alcohol dehydrogenase family)